MRDRSILLALDEQLKQAYLETVQALAAALEARDQYTSGHSDRVGHYVVAIARHLNYSEQVILDFELAAALHDIGKIGTRDNILYKPDPLTPDEWDTMRQHIEIGLDILRRIAFLAPIMPIVRSHHERWDGKGYPDGLSGEAIPLGARLLAVADAFDAMTTDRPYRQKLQPNQAFDILRDGAGTQFDPVLVEAFWAIRHALPHQDAGVGAA